MRRSRRWRKPTGFSRPPPRRPPLALVAEQPCFIQADHSTAMCPILMQAGARSWWSPYNVPGCNDYSPWLRRTPATTNREGPVRLSYWKAVGLAQFCQHAPGVWATPSNLDEFISYAKDIDVWFARRLEIANWCLKQGY